MERWRFALSNDLLVMQNDLRSPSRQTENKSSSKQTWSGSSFLSDCRCLRSNQILKGETVKGYCDLSFLHYSLIKEYFQWEVRWVIIWVQDFFYFLPLNLWLVFCLQWLKQWPEQPIVLYIAWWVFKHKIFLKTKFIHTLDRKFCSCRRRVSVERWYCVEVVNSRWCCIVLIRVGVVYLW